MQVVCQIHGLVRVFQIVLKHVPRYLLNERLFSSSKCRFGKGLDERLEVIGGLKGGKITEGFISNQSKLIENHRRLTLGSRRIASCPAPPNGRSRTDKSLDNLFHIAHPMVATTIYFCVIEA